MKVILKENVDGLGYLGDLLSVADGYARNFLLPRGKAVVANSQESQNVGSPQAGGFPSGQEGSGRVG